MWTVLKLAVVWVWFTTQVFHAACLDMPRLEVGPLSGPYGLYRPTTETVVITPTAPLWVPYHELSHHLFFACDIPDRGVGRRFLWASGHDTWDFAATEEFASTLTWVLTGRAGGLKVRRVAAWTLAPLVHTPSVGQQARLDWGR